MFFAFCFARSLGALWFLVSDFVGSIGWVVFGTVSMLPLGRFFGALWGSLEALSLGTCTCGSTEEHSHGPQSSVGQTVATKLIDLGGGLGASGSIGEHSHGAQSYILAESCSGMIVFRGRGCFKEGPKHDLADCCKDPGCVCSQS